MATVLLTRLGAGLVLLVLLVLHVFATACRGEEDDFADIEPLVPDPVETVPPMKPSAGKRTPAPQPTSTYTPTAPTSEPTHTAPTSAPASASASAPTPIQLDLAVMLQRRRSNRTLSDGTLIAPNGALVVDERSLSDGSEVECFDLALKAAFAMPARAKMWNEAGVQASWGEDGTLHVIFQRTAVVAFTRFSCSAKRTVLSTKGHDLTLVGSDFAAVTVHSEGKGSKAGHVRIIASGSSLPVVSARGASGSSGSDAECPILFPTCLSETPPTSDGQTASVLFEETTTRTLHDPLALAQDGQTFAALLGYSFDPVGPSFETTCSRRVTLSSGPVLSSQGSVLVTEVTRTPRLAADGVAPVTVGLTLPGSDGKPGDPGGNIDFLALDTATLEAVDADAMGGPGGSGGRGGLVAPPLKVAPQRVDETVAETLSAHTGQLFGEYIWSITHFPSLPGVSHCSAGNVARLNPTLVTTARAVFNKASFIIRTSSHALSLGGDLGGALPDRLNGRSAASGPNGKVTRTLATDAVTFLEALTTDARLPAGVARDIQKGWETGRLPSRLAGP